MKLLFFAALLTGCSFKSKNAITFNPTNSMCVDALVSNMQVAGCDVISFEKDIYGISKIYCQDYSGEFAESSWVSNEFFAVAFGTSVPPDTKPICTDPFIVLTSAERD